MEIYIKKLKRFIFSLVIIVLVVIVGASGYMILENWDFTESMFFTIITLSTVGYTIPEGIGMATKVFTIFLILSGITVGLYALSQMTSFIVEGEIKNIMGVRKRMKKISNLNKHFIVIGAGKTGAFVCRNLLKSHKDFVVVDKNMDRLDQLKQELGEDFLYYQGDITDENVMLNAGMAKASTVILTLPSDVDNLFAVLTAKTINEDIKVIAKANEPESVKKLEYAGIDRILVESEISGNRLAYMATQPNVVSFLETVTRAANRELQLEEVEIPENSWMVDKTLKEISLPSLVNLIVISIQKKENKNIFNPRAETKVTKGDVLIVLGEEEKIEKLKKIVLERSK
jgi:voltage-gated potassium channel